MCVTFTLSYYFFFGNLIQDFMLTRQVLDQLSHVPSPFSLVHFSDWVLYFCLGWPQTLILLPLSPEELGLQMYATIPSP
jgi:hypothetical protein